MTSPPVICFLRDNLRNGESIQIEFESSLCQKDSGEIVILLSMQAIGKIIGMLQMEGITWISRK
ncbi:hypothetical protein CH380_07355 [Leptospira adleri]|uniref:Uncharacterized protein n=1 Tax=Leptospira adleri TaxID=2023186 RepID=A0A2M9YQK4_9LEPT|nr:hypothetical protein CH380_07355 [Leptospira adleri]PJZ63158.1 hypothetical protein CH376_04770 [Leptospira adleri]